MPLSRTQAICSAPAPLRITNVPEDGGRPPSHECSVLRPCSGRVCRTGDRCVSMHALFSKVAAILAAYGPCGIFFLAAIDSVGFPLPAAIDLLVAGTAATSASAPVRAYTAALLATLGSLAGNIALFQAARHGRQLFGNAAEPAGTRTRFEAWFERYGLLTVFVPAVTPVAPLPLKMFVVSAGALRTRFGRFLRVILAARTIRYWGLAWLGIQLGVDAPAFLRHNVWRLTGVVLLLVLMLVVAMRWNDTRRNMV